MTGKEAGSRPAAGTLVRERGGAGRRRRRASAPRRVRSRWRPVLHAPSISEEEGGGERAAIGLWPNKHYYLVDKLVFFGLKTVRDYTNKTIGM